MTIPKYARLAMSESLQGLQVVAKDDNCSVGEKVNHLSDSALRVSFVRNRGDLFRGDFPVPRANIEGPTGPTRGV